MSEVEENIIEKLKVAIIYGKREVDGTCKDGTMEKIYKDEDDTAHYYYMKEFLETHFRDEEDMQSALLKRDVNSIFFEIQKLGHIVFAESTSSPRYKDGIFYMPKSISKSQRQALKKFQKQLKKEEYHILEFVNLHRDEDGVLLGNQKIGNADLLDEFTKDEELEL